MISRQLQITMSLLLVSILLLGVYIIRLRHAEETKTEQAVSSAPSTPEAQGRQEKIRVLIAYDDDLALRWREVEAFMPDDRILRARAALRTVLDQYLQNPSPHPLARGAGIKDIYLLGQDTLLIDTTAPFADGHRSGLLVEEMTLASLIETLSANVAGISRVKFLVDGKERETLAGHADLNSFYDIAAIHKLAREFE